jgi:hypothetical protein
MATPGLGESLAGWNAGGRGVAGGGVLPSAFAEAQGESLGANTQNAIEQAQLRKFELEAKQAYEAKLKADPTTAGHAGVIAGASNAGYNPNQQFEAVNTANDVGYRADIANPATDEATRVARAQALSPNGLANPLTDANRAFLEARTNDVSQQTDPKVRLLNARTALTNMQAQHPELFHPQSSLNIPADPAKLRALEQLGVIDPGSASRASISGPAVDAAYYAAFPEDAPKLPPGVAPAPGAAPRAPAPIGGAPAPVAGPQPGAAPTPAERSAALPPLSPGGNSHAEIRQSDLQFASTKPTDPGGKIRAGNALTAHLGLLQQLHDAQQAHDAPTVQKIAAQLGFQVGADDATTAALASHVVGDELNSFLIATGGAEPERKQMQGHFNQASLGATQLQSNIQEARDLMGGQFAALKKAYSTPSARTDAQVAGFNRRYMLSPDILDEWEQKHGPVTRGGARAPATAAPGAAAPKPGAAADPLGIR